MKLTRDEHMRAEGALNALDIAGKRILELESENATLRDEFDDYRSRLWCAIGQPPNVEYIEAAKAMRAQVRRYEQL